MKKDENVDYSRARISQDIRKHAKFPSKTRTIQDVIDTMNDEQKLAVECIILCMIDDFTKGQGGNK